MVLCPRFQSVFSASMKLVALFSISFFVSSCATGMIPGTTIPDEGENRAIVAVVEQYRLTLEARDVEGVLALLSVEFNETNGTTDPKDDYGVTGLRSRLEQDFAKLKAIRVEMNLNEIIHEPPLAKVRYRLNMRFKADLPAGDKNYGKTDVAQMVLKHEGETWKILSGI